MTSRKVRPPLERLSTGIPGLDEVLHGGFPSLSVNMISGEPGTGKTVLALQIMFEAARKGMKCVYFTTLSEPPTKLIRTMQHLTFFDLKQFQDQIVFVDIGTVMRTGDVEAILAILTGRVEEHGPVLVVIDSFKAVHDLIEPESSRAFIYDLAITTAGWGATTLLVGEYTRKERLAVAEFAIADGIVELRTRQSELKTIRELEIWKLRGSGYASGTHFYDITEEGIDFVPRVRAPDLPITAQPRTFDKLTCVSTGVEGLDTMLHGGWPKGSTTVTVGGTGTGKTVLALEFLIEGARRGEAGVLLALEEDPDQIRATARGFGWEIEELEKNNLLTIHYTPPIELSTDRFLLDARNIVTRTNARRLVLDSLTSVGLGAVSEKRFKELVYALTKHMRGQGVTSLMNLEVSELLGSGRISAHGLSFAADNVLLVRYVETMGRLERAIAIIKARGLDHEAGLYALKITGTGIEIGRPLSDMQGVLTGFPYQLDIRRP